MECRTYAQLLSMLTGLITISCSGCVGGVQSQHRSLTADAIPAHRLPSTLQTPSKDEQVWIDFTRLSQTAPPEHIVGPGDVLGIHIPSVLDVEGELPAVTYPSPGAGRLVNSPSVGQPVTVGQDGTVRLPLVAPIQVAGRTISDAADAIIQPYLAASLINDRRVTATVNLIKPRTTTVFVIRQDVAASDVTLIRRDSSVLTKHGSAYALEMAAFKNDVLHLLAETGGLPGEDAANELWILRNVSHNEVLQTQMLASLEAGMPPEVAADHAQTSCTRIPLRICPGDDWSLPPGIGILQEGDVVFIPARDTEYFYTGGLIEGGKFPLPRDHDTDIMEAIAIANGKLSGPAGLNAAASNFRTGPGNIVPPTRAVIVRKLPSGEQVKILVDLRTAMNNPRERVNVMPGDFILLKYRPSEIAANVAFNFVNFNYQLSR